MPLTQLRNVNFGSTLSSGSDIGYTILDQTGAVTVARTTAGITQIAPGIYSAYPLFPSAFHGQILWDTGTSFSTVHYAAEQYNVEENNPAVDQISTAVTQISGTISSLYSMQFGRWQIVANQMIFFKEDNVTEVARFNLYDSSGNPTMDAVFDRVKI